MIVARLRQADHLAGSDGDGRFEEARVAVVMVGEVVEAVAVGYAGIPVSARAAVHWRSETIANSAPACWQPTAFSILRP